MSNRKNPADPSALEYALEQLESLTASIVASLNQAIETPQAELSSSITQQILLRGQLLHEAHLLTKEAAPQLQPHEHEALTKKLAQLQVLHTQMGDLLNQHHERIKSAIQENSITHVGVKAYQKTQTDAEFEPYLNDA
jgi:DNA-binding HxlR family transcriptional regulator